MSDSQMPFKNQSGLPTAWQVMWYFTIWISDKSGIRIAIVFTRGGPFMHYTFPNLLQNLTLMWISSRGGLGAEGLLHKKHDCAGGSIPAWDMVPFICML